MVTRWGLVCLAALIGCIPNGTIGGRPGEDGGETVFSGGANSGSGGAGASADSSSGSDSGVGPSATAGPGGGGACLDPDPSDPCYGLSCDTNPPTGTCHGRVCGDDGLGTSCGTCAEGSTCSPEGQCVGCVPTCDDRECGSDQCGGSCGSCGLGSHCSVGECIAFGFEDSNEMWSAYFINEFRTQAQTYDTNGNPILTGFPRPETCTDEVLLDQPKRPIRLNADMVENARRSAQHIVQYTIDNPEYPLCQHYDPVDQVGALGDRIGAYLGSQGCQNIWCGFVPPEAAPITGDHGHCECMLYGENDWGIGAFSATQGPGIQVQDPATDSHYLAVIIDHEAVTTATPQVDVFVPDKGFDGWTALGTIVEVQLSEDPCFEGAAWQPYSANLTYTFSDTTPGRKVLWGRVKDTAGKTAVSWDSIFLGDEPDDVDALEEGIRRIRKVRIPPLDAPGYDAFQYSLGMGLEMEHPFLSWFATQNVVSDADATGGTAVWGNPRGYNGGRSFAPMQGDIYVRAKLKNDPPGDNPVLWATWREDTGGLVGGRGVKADEFDSIGAFEWLRVPFTHVWGQSLFYFEFSTAGSDVLLDRFDVFSQTIPLERTRQGGGMTLDFDDRNYRGIEIQIRYVNTQTGAWADGPRINPYCATCSETDAVIASCSEGFVDCNDDAVDGCETDITVARNHCGACGNVCPTGGDDQLVQCIAGECVSSERIAVDQGGAFALTADAQRLYWTNWYGGTVMAMPFGGTPIEIASGQPRPSGVAVSDAHVYWSNIEGGAIMRAAKGGGEPTTVVSGQDGPRGLVVDGGQLFWTNYIGTGKIQKANADGSGVTKLAEYQGGASRIATDASYVYWTAGGNGNVMRVGKNGGAPEVVASNQDWPYGLALDDSHVYWSNFEGGTIMRATKDGGVPEVLAEGQRGPRNLLLFQGQLFWTNYFGGEVTSLTLAAPGQPRGLATGQSYAVDLVLADGALHWTTMSHGGPLPFDFRHGTVMRATP